MITRRRISSYNNANNRTSFAFFKNYETNNFIFYLTGNNYYAYLASDNNYIVKKIPIFQIYDVYTGDGIPSRFLTNIDLYTAPVNTNTDPENPINFGSITPEFLGYEYDSSEDQYYAKIALHFNNFSKYGKDTIYGNYVDEPLTTGGTINIYSCYNDELPIYAADPDYLDNPMYFKIGSGMFELDYYKNINLIENYPIENIKDTNGVRHPTPNISIFTNILHDEEYIHIVELKQYWDSDLVEFFIPSISFNVEYDSGIYDGTVTSVVKYISSIDIYFNYDVKFSHNIIFDSPVKLGNNDLGYLFNVTLPDFACRVIPINSDVYRSVKMYISVHYSLVKTTYYEE